MKEIALRNGGVALVDDCDFATISARPWWDNGRGYASTRVRSLNRTLYMHREIMGAKVGQQVDHINGNRLDNRRENLRLCSQAQNNAAGRMMRAKTSAMRGVHWCKHAKAFVARIVVNRRSLYLGKFRDESEAGRAYDRAALDHYGEFASLNFPKAA